MNTDVRAAVAAVAGRLGERGVRCLLGGSGMLWAVGLADTVRDVDLMVDADDRDAFAAATSQWLVRCEDDEPADGLWASRWFCELDVDGVAVDGIGSMALRHAGGVAVLPMRAGGSVEVEGVTVEYADPALWWVVYRAYKPEKARLLERLVGFDERLAVAAELGVEPPER